MPSFRPPAARKAVQSLLALGQPRHPHRQRGRIHSVGTARNYEQALKGVATWQAQHRIGSLPTLTPEQALAYLQARAPVVRQKTLDLDRQALQAHLSHLSGTPVKHPVVRAAPPTRLRPRAYTPAQVAQIVAQQAPPQALATQLAAAAGLRAQELFTLRPAAEQPASRPWPAARFLGRDGVVRYTVVGKGGLIREVAVPQALAAQLEARRLAVPVRRTDRKVHYLSSYAVGGGQAWSQAVTTASRQVLGWSAGAHGLRHAYAQTRLETLQAAGITYREALGRVAQELGHFASATSVVYLR